MSARGTFKLLAEPCLIGVGDHGGRSFGEIGARWKQGAASKERDNQNGKGEAR